MKKIFTLIAVVVFLTSMILPASAQSPEKMSYQAVIRNASDNLVTNTEVGMQISILKGSSTGAPVYTETQTPITNENGLISIEIGTGTTSDDFSTIDWAIDNYFIKTETDPAGGTNYTITGTSQLLSVPYAFHSKTADSIIGGYDEIDPIYNASVASKIDENDTTNWNNKLDNYIETQNLADVIAINNSANDQIKSVTDPIDPQDAATKAYVDLLIERIEILELETGIRFQDMDGNIYTTVRIGNQFWMSENLKTTKFKNGTEIALVTDNATWNSLTSPSYCWYNNDEANNKDTYGALYNWYAVQGDSLCPTGWHVPTDSEWTTLTDYLGGESIAGSKLKEIGTNHWEAPNTDATNESGFAALPGGCRAAGEFISIRLGGFWWTSTIASPENAYYRAMSNDGGSVGKVYESFSYGKSIRCIRD